VRIEAELVDGVVARESLPEECGNPGDALSKLVERCFGCGCRTRRTPALIDFANGGCDLFGRRPTAWISK
jgi:hypothetical protein